MGVTIGEVMAQALRRHSDRVAMVPFEEALLDAFQGSPNRPPAVLVAVPEQVVRNIKGDPAQRYHYYILAIPPDVWDQCKTPVVLLT